MSKCRLTRRHGKHAVQIGGETRRNDIGWQALADYEDMEEQGRLIELPCAVGDTVYFITQNAEREYIIGSGRFSCSWLDYPRTIYTTKEEAEAKLEELKGE